MNDSNVSVTVEICATSAAPVSLIRPLLDLAFDGQFDDHDWQHALGGRHVVASIEGAVVAHAAVVPRRLTLGSMDGPVLHTGYVEAVAVHPTFQRRSFGTLIMGEVSSIIVRDYEMGALSAASPDFYLRLGWVRWLGPTNVGGPHGWTRTDDDDDLVYVCPGRHDPLPDVRQPIACDWRQGEPW